ncbi:tyrosinase family protein [Pseudomonas sp. N40(2020)]|uniref:tyrosinase family protein n=1 Tax=Pseudomonas sp. N40(2020) TaxID=2767798 RepID=UPI001656D2F7|nr:tyrosinase family protein [Pseudomonas sp. N40(2020)]MBC9000009.1 tyrosinase family protein [Pseudomonas sp. N40(2020)]
MDIRRNHRDLTRQQKQAFISAIYRLKNDVPSILRPGLQSRYDDFVQIHKNSMGLGSPLNPNPHRSPLFFPWHRILIRQFERALQAASRDSSITLPYWNWSMSGANDPFTDDFMGRDGDPLQNQRVTFGPFAFESRLFTVNVLDNDQGDSGLLRNLGGGGALPSTEDIEAALDRTPYWSVPDGWENIAETMHNGVHAWVGGNMGTASSPNDPVFFLHHCHLDYLWERWKRANPLEPSISFEPDTAEQMLASRLIFHPDNEPAPWTDNWTVREALDPLRLDYTYAW